MLGIKCPVCRMKNSTYLEGLLRPIYSSMYCVVCGAKLELLNPGICYFANGILFSVILLLLVLKEVQYLWLWVILLGIFLWLINPVIVRLLGRWGLWSYSESEAAKLQLLNSVNAVSTLIAGIWILYMAITLLGPYWKIVANLASNEEQLFDATEQYKRIFSIKGIIGLIIGVVSVITATTTRTMKNRIRAKSNWKRNANRYCL